MDQVWCCLRAMCVRNLGQLGITWNPKKKDSQTIHVMYLTSTEKRKFYMVLECVRLFYMVFECARLVNGTKYLSRPRKISCLDKRFRLANQVGI